MVLALTPSQGFIQFDVGEEEDAGRLGPVARREKEAREIERRQLTGQEGKQLYLEAFQLTLRNQLLWLVNQKGHKEELETVVRDLWDLRIRGSGALLPAQGTEERELEVFSSQAMTEEAGSVIRSNCRGQSWDPGRGSAWPLPRLPDTLALCYLGCLLLRIPTRIGELISWANNGNIPYKQAVSSQNLALKI